MTTTGETESVYGLAFETSGALGAVALGRGPDVLDVRQFSGPRRHAVEFLPTIDAICRSNAVKASQIERIYVSSGPGSFTGLRIGVTAARLISLANDASIVAVPTLEVIAQNALRVGCADNVTDLASGDGERDPCRGDGLATWQHDQPPERVVVLLDAKRSRVYTAVFEMRGDRYMATGDPVEADPARFLGEQRALGGSCAVLGEGVLYHRPAVEASGLPILAELLFPPRAETVYHLGVIRATEVGFVDRRALIPTYVRPPEAEEKWQQRHKAR